MADEKKILIEESLDPEDWEAERAIGHRMLDDMLDSLRDVRQRPAWRHAPEQVKAHFRSPVPLDPEPLERPVDHPRHVIRSQRREVIEIRHEFRVHARGGSKHRVTTTVLSDQCFDTGIDVCTVKSIDPGLREGRHVCERLLGDNFSVAAREVPSAFDES